MNIVTKKKLPSGKEITKLFPLSKKEQVKIKKDQEEVKNIIEEKDSRFLVIVGPCSAWPMPAVLDYAQKLKKIETKYKDYLKIVMRVYIQKPRTIKGWLGSVNQPDPFKKADIKKGISYSREMMVKVLRLGLPISDEALFTHNTEGFLELLSWVAIGARSAEDQEHRNFASMLPFAVGLKNPTCGSVEIGINSVVAAQSPDVATFFGYEVQTKGNPYSHLVLRGGMQGPNYSLNFIKVAIKEMEKHKINNPSIILDASHDNSLMVNGLRNHTNQMLVVRESLETLKKHPELLKVVKGFMLESFIKEGSQKVDPKNPEKLDMGGLSITDACLSWNQTKEILAELAEFKKLYGKNS